MKFFKDLNGSKFQGEIMYNNIIENVPQLKRGLVWCKKCGREESVNSSICLRNGWPECCGETMTIDAPETWKD